MFSIDLTLKEHERAIVWKGGLFDRWLAAGRHRLRGFGPAPRVERFSTLTPYVDLPDARAFAELPELAPHFLVVKIADAERGLVFAHGNFERFLAPGVHVFLRLAEDVLRVDVVDASSLSVVHPAKEAVSRSGDAAGFLEVFEVTEGFCGVLFVDGAIADLLAPGRHVFWKAVRQLALAHVDLRQQLVEVQGQELMTKDKVSLRINLSVRFAVLDARLMVRTLADGREALYRELQLALRDEVGALTLDELLLKKGALGAALVSRTAPALAERGLSLIAAGLRDVVLPGDMRTLFNQVIEAEKRAEATAIARREETAATRSLLNTAKLLEGNPTLLRLKELEITERIAQRIGSLSVTGGVDSLVDAMRAKLGP
ncbi:MAG: slipin family protein [Myxococcales bacterium]|nr:slipin family protein [Myxococcales bacterium]